MLSVTTLTVFGDLDRSIERAIDCEVRAVARVVTFGNLTPYANDSGDLVLMIAVMVIDEPFPSTTV